MLSKINQFMKTPIDLQTAQKIIINLKLDPTKMIGQGGEGWIFEYDGQRVIKIYNDGDEKYLKSLSAFQDYLAATAHFPFAIPQIYEIKQTSENVFYTIEKKLHGLQLEPLFSRLESKKQFQVLEAYFNGVLDIGEIQLPQLPFGNILDIQGKITAKSWSDFLIKKLRQRSAMSKSKMLQEVKNYKEKITRLEKIIKSEIKTEEKCLVHGDYYLNNVLIEDSLRISAVLDLSQHAMVGDPRLDVAGAISFLGINPNVKEEHFDFLYSLAEKKYGESVRKSIDIYTLFFSFYYCYLYRTDLASHQWVVRNLNNEKMWRRLS